MAQADTATMTLLVRPIVVSHERCHEDEARSGWGLVARCRAHRVRRPSLSHLIGEWPELSSALSVSSTSSESSCPYTTDWQPFPGSPRDRDIRMPSSPQGGWRSSPDRWVLAG